MRIVDLSHTWGLHTPGWVGYPGAKMYYTQNLQTNQIVSQAIETSLHSGTHLDGPMHGTDGGLDMASLPLTKLIHEGGVLVAEPFQQQDSSMQKVFAQSDGLIIRRIDAPPVQSGDDVDVLLLDRC